MNMLFTHNSSTASSKHWIYRQATSRALTQGMPCTITICGSNNRPMCGGRLSFSGVHVGGYVCALVCMCMLVHIRALLYNLRIVFVFTQH